MGTPFQNTLATWHALFLQESINRLFGVRVAWAWLIIEPAMHMAFMAFIFGVIRQQQMGGMDVVVWICVGMLAFFLFRRTAVQAMHAIDCNRAFFVFRQVRPFDAVFVRAASEAFIMTFISLFILSVMGFIGRDVIPNDPLLVAAALAGLWSFGLGYGMIVSVCMRILPESSHVFSMLMMPLYLISGVIMPISAIPLPYRNYLLWNPLVHGIESVRMGFLAQYTSTIGINLGYLYVWAIVSVAFGLVLYRLYETRLVTL